MDLATTSDATDSQVKRVNWSRYKNLLKIKNISVTEAMEIDAAVNNLQNAMLEAIDAATTAISARKANPLSAHIVQLIREKNQFKKVYKRTLHQRDKTQLNKYTNLVKEAIKKHKNKEWEEKLKSLSVEDQSLWQITKAILQRKNTTPIPALKWDNQMAIIGEEKVEMFADCMEEQFTLHHLPNPQIETAVQENTQRFETQLQTEENDKNETIETVTMEEVNDIVNKLKARKAPGRDGITNEAIKKLTEEGRHEIVNITNAIIQQGHFTAAWKSAKIIMLKKPQKPANEADSYRPISLLPALSKLVERIIYRRIKEHTEQKKILPNHQFGFRCKHSTTQQIIRVTEDIVNNFNISTETGAVLIDVAKAGIKDSSIKCYSITTRNG